ncbi:hypothetical protein CRYUN_Cryun18bG0078300 [Craigia yunnanensis]
MLLYSSLVTHCLIQETTTISTELLIIRQISGHKVKPSSITLRGAEYAGVPLIPAYIQPGKSKFIDGMNFASGGAGALVETHQGFVISLKTLVSYFKKVEKSLQQELGDVKAHKLLSRAVYLISIGTNGYLFSFIRNSSVLQPYVQEELVAMVIRNMTVAVKVSCLPSLKAPVDEATKLAQLHNKALLSALQNLKNQLRRVKIFTS